MAFKYSHAFVANLSLGYEADLHNDIFKNTNEYKRLSKYYGAYSNNVVSILTGNLAMNQSVYQDKMNAVYTTLFKHGLSVFPKYEKRIKEKTDECLVEQRAVKIRQLKRSKKPVENPDAWDYATLTVNGKKFLLFENLHNKGDIEAFSGKELNIEGEKKEELMKMLQEQDITAKELFYVMSNYSIEGGEKALISEAYDSIIFPQFKAKWDEIRKMLN